MAITCNLGRTDRAIRILVGIALGVAGVFVSHPFVGVLLGIAGAIVILSAAWGT